MMNKMKAKAEVQNLKYYLILIVATLLIYFVGYSIPLFGVNTDVSSVFGESASVYYLSLVTGGNLSKLTLFALGMGPIITSAIIVQLLESELSSKVKSWRELGDTGKKYKDRLQLTITAITATIISIGVVLGIYLNSPSMLNYGLLASLCIVSAQLVGASMLLQMLAKWVDERFFYTGTSLLLSYGVILNLIDTLSFDMFTTAQFAVVSVLFIIISIIIITVNTSSIELMGTSFNYSNNDDHPLRISFSQTGVIALIYAAPLMVLGNFLLGKLTIENEIIANMFNLGNANVLTIIIYFALILIFSTLYTYIVMDTDIISDNLLKQGYYIYDVNPGKETATFMKSIILRVGFVGGLLIGFIACLPYVISLVYTLPGITLILSTSLIIILNTATKLFNIIYINYKREV